MISIFNYAFNPETANFIKYHLFGIGFPKSFIYSRGGPISLFSARHTLKKEIPWIGSPFFFFFLCD